MENRILKIPNETPLELKSVLMVRMMAGPGGRPANHRRGGWGRVLGRHILTIRMIFGLGPATILTIRKSLRSYRCHTKIGKNNVSDII